MCRTPIRLRHLLRDPSDGLRGAGVGSSSLAGERNYLTTKAAELAVAPAPSRQS